MNTSKIILKKNEDIRIRNGHLWVFSNEIFKTDGNPENGDLVEVYDSRDSLLGAGFYNKNSLISFRLLDRNKITDLHSVLRKKILRANSIRKELYPNRNSFRLVFSESDFFPGLIIDKYNDTFVLQVYSFGMENNISLINRILQEDLGAKNIFTKNESYYRKLEGLPEADTIYLGEQVSEIIDDGKIKYKIDFNTGHKTGFYFDQSDNRLFIERLCNGKTFLDAFCNSGGFGLHAAAAGSSKIVLVDSSQSEIENARANYQLNELNSEAEFVTYDVFDYFGKLISERKKFDIVNIDPPAFAKNKKNLPVARKGYEKLNRLALELVSDGGYLVSSSCSFHLKADEFLRTLNSAANKAGKQISLIHFSGASLDHPKLPAMEETSYLKFALVKVHN